MTYESIGKELGISKQAVSQHMKKGINKLFLGVEKISDDAYDTLKTLVYSLNINNHADFKQFYKLLNKDIKERIESNEEWRNVCLH